MKNKKQLIVVLCCALVILSVCIVTTVGAMGGGMGGPGGGMPSGGGNPGGEGEDSSAQNTQILVETQPVETGSIELSTEYVGKLEPGRSLDVYPEISGKVTAVYYNVGDTVHKGDLLMTIDSSDIENEIAAAAASLEITKLSVESTLGSNYDSKLISQESTYDSSKLNYSKALDALQDYQDEGNRDDLEDAMDETYDAMIEARNVYRSAESAVESKKEEIENYTSVGASGSTLEQLQKELSALEEELSTTASAYSTAQSVYNQAKDAYNTYDEDVEDLITSLKSANISLTSAEESLALTKGKALEETKASAEAQLNQAQLSYDQKAQQLEKTRLYAPIDGVIEAKNLDEAENAATQTAAFTITNQDTMLASFNVSADAIGSLAIGDAVTITRGQETFTGSIVEIGQKLDFSTGLLAVKAQVDAGDASLVNGMTVKVSATTSKAEDVLVVPVSAVSYEDGQAYLYVLDGTTAVRTEIETGLSNKDNIEVISGLSAGDQIITTWHPDLADGATVTLAGEEPASDTPDDGSAPAGNEELSPEAAVSEGAPSGSGESPQTSDKPSVPQGDPSDNSASEAR